MKKLPIVLAVLATLSIGVAVKADSVSREIHYQQWAAAHHDWVMMHPDRARWFAAHPDLADKYRAEWMSWETVHPQFNEWAEHHPGWITGHKDRADYFRAHPDAAMHSQKEWLQHKETKAEYKEWAHNHP